MRNDEVIKQFIQLNRATEGSCAFHCALCLSSKEIEVKQKFSLCRKEMRTHAYGSKNGPKPGDDERHKILFAHNTKWRILLTVVQNF